MDFRSGGSDGRQEWHQLGAQRAAFWNGGRQVNRVVTVTGAGGDAGCAAPRTRGAAGLEAAVEEVKDAGGLASAVPAGAADFHAVAAAAVAGTAGA